jgi:hypothetical protein
MRALLPRVDPAASLAGASPSDVAEILRLLRQIAKGIDILVTRTSRAMPPIAAYGADDAELLHAISASSGGRVFRVADLLLRAEVVADRAEDRRLRDAILGALGEVNGKRLGQLLRRVEGADIDSLCVARVGRARDGISWRVATSAGSKTAKVVAPPASNVKSCADGT